MLNDPHLKVLKYVAKSSDVFPNVGFKGGVAITYRDANDLHNPIGTFTIFPELRGIINKVIFRTDFSSLSSIIYLQNKFNLDVLYSEHPEIKSLIGSNGRERRLTTSILDLPIFSDSKDKDHEIEIKGLVKNKRIAKFIKGVYLDDNSNLQDYKVIVPKSNGSGALGEVLSTPLIGYTQSFIGIGKFLDKFEAEACLKYVKSKFCRVMLGTLKVTQDNNVETWKNVPLQDFSVTSSIDWTKSIHEIDLQLYNKYGLTQEEQDFIESHVKEMA